MNNLDASRRFLRLWLRLQVALWPQVALWLCVSTTLAAEPTAQQLKLLRIFRAEFVAITPGEGPFPRHFTMGGPDVNAVRHEVQLAYSFSMSRFEIPQNLWSAVTGREPSRWRGERNSVERLNFDEALAFCRQVTELMSAAKLIGPDEEIRLPSEAEWEYCARAGTTTDYSFGDQVALLNDYAWSTANAAGNDPPVGAKKRNPWGLYDMHGYVWEWCQDTWHESYAGAPADGSAWVRSGDESQRVIRGGSWKDTAEKLTSFYRRGISKDYRGDDVGLRCVLAKRR